MAAEQRVEALDANILASRQNTIRESARIGYTDLGDFYYNRGELQVGVLGGGVEKGTLPHPSFCFPNIFSHPYCCTFSD